MQYARMHNYLKILTILLHLYLTPTFFHGQPILHSMKLQHFISSPSSASHNLFQIHIWESKRVGMKIHIGNLNFKFFDFQVSTKIRRLSLLVFLKFEDYSLCI